MKPDELVTLAQRWLEADPDPLTRGELSAVLERGDPALLAELFESPVGFGTAGLRALVGPGPARMNRAVIRRTTAGVARHLLGKHGASGAPLVAVGADARPASSAFLADTVGVLAAHGLSVRFFPKPVPTPLVVYAAGKLGAAAAIVITASHNPPAYNGYKLYGSDFAQVAPPEEGAIAREIERSGDAASVPFVSDVSATARVEALDDSWLDAYVREITTRLAALASPRTELRIAYTPLHGVGYEPARSLLHAAGFRDLHVVAEQRDPDGTFPTVPFPNPEEPGALDRLLALAGAVKADLALANDPDADRLAAAVSDGAGGHRVLSGNELGLLLADFVLERSPKEPRPLVLQSVVSSPMLGAIASAHGARLERTLTGFKWIWRAALALTEREPLAFAFAYEEALGYSVGDSVRDKDGISAALALAWLAAHEKAGGGSVHARLERLLRRHGAWVSVQHSVVREGVAGARAIREALERLCRTPPRALGGHTIEQVRDFRVGAEARPPWLPSAALIELGLGARGRILVRPSGTEPKLKLYVDLLGEPDADVWAAQAQARERAEGLALELVSTLGL